MSIKDDILEVIDSDDFYDILPGDGKDDYICSYLRRHVEEIFKRYETTSPKQHMDAIIAGKVGDVS